MASPVLKPAAPSLAPAAATARVSRRFGLLRTRLVSFAVDWASIAYVFGAVLYLYSVYYEYNVPPYNRLEVPAWVWWALPVAAAELAGIWRSFGLTLGMRLSGIRVEAPGSRLIRFLAWQVTGGAPLLAWALVESAEGAGAALALEWTLAVAVSGLLVVLGYGRLLLAGMEGVWPDRVSGRRVEVVDPLARANGGLAAEETGSPQAPRRPWYATGWGLMAATLLVVTLVTGWVLTDVDLGRLASRASRTQHIWRALFTPETDILLPTIGAMIETIYMALMATILGVAIAVPLSFLGARNLMAGHPLLGLVYVVTRAILNFVRSIEPLIWGIIFVVWVRVGPFAGVLALAVHSVAALGKLYSEAIESVDPGPIEAIAATGATRVQTVAYAVVPQVIPPFLAFTIYRWDINVRMSTIIGLVGGGGIGQMLFQYTNLLRWNEAATVMWLIVAVVWVMDYASAKIRERIV